MNAELCLANATLILRDEVVPGSVLIRDGAIAEVATGAAVPAGAVDCGGDAIAPGMVELHTDNLERHLSPRPAVKWPYRAAIMAHDRELASTGITTVFDALRLGFNPKGATVHGKYARAVADEILGLRDAGALRISHHLHLRAEVCSQTLSAELEEFDETDRVGIVSVMDHTPGQRQFRNLKQLETYHKGKYGLSDAGFEAHVAFLAKVSAEFGAKHQADAVAAARRLGAMLASHDDTTVDHVAVSAGFGASIAEFPTTTAAAHACVQAGLRVVMGAPNLVRGGSHSGNVSAAELAMADCVDILSSDYVPSALLLAAVQLGEIWGDMARGIATVTANPARSVGLEDRGAIAVGQRGDLMRFGMLDGAPVLRGVFVQGVQVG